MKHHEKKAIFAEKKLWNMKNTDAFRQFCWLINTLLQAKKMSLEQIQARWIDDNLNERKPLSRTTFYRLRQAIEDMFGIIIECDTNDNYQYFISNPEVLKDNSTQNWMLQTLTVNNVLADSLAIKDRLVLEEIPAGMDLMIPTFDFRQEILREGSELEVLEPESFRKEIKAEILNSSKRYS